MLYTISLLRNIPEIKSIFAEVTENYLDGNFHYLKQEIRCYTKVGVSLEEYRTLVRNIKRNFPKITIHKHLTYDGDIYLSLTHRGIPIRITIYLKDEKKLDILKKIYCKTIHIEESKAKTEISYRTYTCGIPNKVRL